MQSVMNHKFSDAPTVNIPRSTFDRSHGVKTTFDAGNLVPIFVDEALPGDTFKCDLTGFARLATPIYPIMDNMFMETFFFAIPHRLVWDNWQKFCGEQTDPGDSIDYTIPQVPVNNAANESLYDYLGIPTQIAADIDVNSLVMRALNLTWNEWFRDQNLQDSLDVPKDDGPDLMSEFTLQKRNKRHDYFSSALPFLQKGDAVQLSLGSSAPVVPHASQVPTLATADGDRSIRSQAGDDDMHFSGGNSSTTGSGIAWTTTGMETDLSSATAGTVNELRQAIQVQRLLEKDARSGTRYTEIVKSHFGVTSADSRLQRPEYLGGGSTPVIVSPVQTTAGGPGSGTGELGAQGVAAFKGHGFVKSFTEHCIVIGLVNVRADLTYQEGLEKMWSRQTRYDYYWPTLAHLGEQAILNKEIYLDAATIGAGTDEDVFGYQERFAEYRYKPSRISGKFRSNDAASLDAWHLGIEFGSTPTLDSDFIIDNPPIDRVIATPTEPHFIYDSYIKLITTRPMPVYSIPGFIDHF